MNELNKTELIKFNEYLQSDERRARMVELGGTEDIRNRMSVVHAADWDYFSL